MDDWALYRIDRYIRLGGKVLFALDGVHINTAGGLEGRAMEDKGLLGMVSHYGATVKPELALDQAALTVPFQTGRQVRLVRYPFWISAQGQGGNRNHPVTAQFGGLDFFWPSPLELNPPQGVEAEILVSSSPRAWLMTRDFNANPESAYLYEREQEDSLGTKTLAAALSGVFPSWFEGQPKPVREGSPEELPDMSGAARTSRIIVLGDRDLAGSFMQVSQSQDRNLDFLFLCADWLGNDDDIIGIRNRQGGGRLDKISDPGKREAAMAFSRIINVYLIPLLVIALGFFMAWKRKSQAPLKTGVSGVPGASPSPEGVQIDE